MGKPGQARQVFRTFGSKAKRAGRVKTGEKMVRATPKLKKDIKPGSILILLAGRFRGRRVVFLKQLASGLLLVTGPYAVNGVPLRRVQPRMCIATSTSVDVKGADVSSVSDDYFKREQKKRGKKDASVFAADAPSAGKSDEKKAGQKKTDEPIVKGLDADTKSYLKARFSLTSKMYPHEMKF